MEPLPGWSSGELVAFDLETTGVDPFDDVPVSYALVSMCGGVLDACQYEAAIVDPGREIPTSAIDVHGITTARARSEGVSLEAAVTLLASRLLDASRRGAAVVGMKIDYDLTMLDSCYRRTYGRGLADDGFCGPVVDVLVLDRQFDRYRKGKRTLGDLCIEYGVVIDRAHDAISDAKATLALVSAMCRRYPTLCSATLPELHQAQVGWHRGWTVSMSAWRMGRGLPPLGGRERDWPIASVEGPLAVIGATVVTT